MTEQEKAARDARRKARAKAFLREKPKAGKAWTSKQYEYDKELGDENVERRGVS